MQMLHRLKAACQGNGIVLTITAWVAYLPCRLISVPYDVLVQQLVYLNNHKQKVMVGLSLRHKLRLGLRQLQD